MVAIFFTLFMLLTLLVLFAAFAAAVYLVVKGVGRLLFMGAKKLDWAADHNLFLWKGVSKWVAILTIFLLGFNIITAKDELNEDIYEEITGLPLPVEAEIIDNGEGAPQWQAAFNSDLSVEGRVKMSYKSRDVLLKHLLKTQRQNITLEDLPPSIDTTSWFVSDSLIAHHNEFSFSNNEPDSTGVYYLIKIRRDRPTISISYIDE